MAEGEEKLKKLLIKVKEENEKAGLKLNIQKTKIVLSGPNTSLEIDGEIMEAVAGCISLGSKISVHEIKRCLLLGRKATKNLDCILKSRDTTLPKNRCLVKAMVFTVVTYESEIWAIEKAEC